MTTFNSTMRQANRRLVVTVGGAALALAALAGVAGYQVGLHSHAGARQAVTQPVTPRDGLAAGNVAAATGSIDRDLDGTRPRRGSGLIAQRRVELHGVANGQGDRE